MTFLAIYESVKFFFQRFVWFPIADHPRISIPIIGVVLLAVFIGIAFHSCGRKPLKIDQGSLEKINSPDRHTRLKELQKVADNNADVVRTADNRMAIAETNVVERNRLIDERIKDADRKIEEAKAQGKDVTGPELECMLVPAHCP